MTPPDPWHEVSAARLPAPHIRALAPVRHLRDVRVLLAGANAWVYWPAGQAEVVRCLLPVPGVAFFTRRANLWVRFGCRIPSGDAPPDDEGVPVAAALVPARFEPLLPPTLTLSPVPLSVTRGGVPRAAVALTCTVGELAAWGDGATTAELARLRAARSDGRAVVLGDGLPPVPNATRYWGDQVLVPIGFRPDPDLPAPALRDAVGAAKDDLLLLDETGAELIPHAAFAPLTRAGARTGARLT